MVTKKDNRIREIYRSVGDRLGVQSQGRAVFNNPTARGDGREDSVRNEIRKRLGDTYGVQKAEVVDANGLGTPEYDAAIFDATTLPALVEDGIRRIVRIESLIATVEIKSELDKSAFEQVDRSLGDLMQLSRFYLPSDALALTADWVRMRAGRVPDGNTKTKEFEDSLKKLHEGITPISSNMNIPAVFTTLFAYGGPSINTAREYLQSHSMLIDAVCVLGRYTIYLKKNHPMSAPEGYTIWGEGRDAWGAFMNLIEFAVTRHAASRYWVTPDVCRYYRPTADDPNASGRVVEPE